MFNKILVPLDGSQLAERALAPALDMARHAHSDVLLLRVAMPVRMLIPADGGYGVLWPDESVDRNRTEGEQYLEATRRAYAQPEFIVHTAVMEGDAASLIVNTAVEENIDLIAMSTHGYSGVTRWVLGSVAEKVLSDAPCPVLIVRSEKPIRRVLIPLDGSPLSELALAPALELAAHLQAEATLLRVIEPVGVPQIEYYEQIELGLGLRMQRDLHDNAEDYLRDLLTTHPHTKLHVHTEVAEGSAAEQILKFAETRGVDLIAMATHGRSGLQRWMYGSVTQKVMRGGCCSMLIVRPAMQHLN